VRGPGGFWFDRTVDVLPILAALAIAAGSPDAGLDRATLVEPRETGPTSVQLDADPEPESVDVRRHGEFAWTPRILDPCFGRKRLGPTNEAVAIDRVAQKNAPATQLLWVSGFRGASARYSDTRLWRLGPNTDARGCPKLNLLFAFPDQRNFPVPKPRKGTEAGGFSAEIRMLDGHLAIRSWELLYRRSDPGCCPRYTRISEWRLDPELDRFTRTRSRTERTHRG
jgi:hypothetical protein